MKPVRASACTLEPQTAAHAHEMFGVLSDAAIYEFENEPPSSEAWLEKRFTALESRSSPDGDQAWLNWVVRLPGGELAGYVQATVLRSGAALVAYELASRFWRKGIGRSAVSAMLEELRSGYDVRTFVAVLRGENYRSLGLLRSLGFEPASPALMAEFKPEPGEVVMAKSSSSRSVEPMRVRAFASEDRKALERIYLDSRAEAAWLPAEAKGKADFLRDTKGEILFVAVGDEGEPRGFVSVWEPKAFIHHLYVRADSRGMGIGVMLLDYLRDRLPMPWQLKCVRENANAIAFYSRRGWIEVGAGSGEEGPFALMEKRPAK